MKKYKFLAKIEAVDRGGAHVLFPYDVEKEFGTKGMVRVKVLFDGVPYSGSLVKYGKPEHMLPMLKAIREQIQKGPGDTVRVELWKDEAPRVVEPPAVLRDAMVKNGVVAIFDGLSYTNRKEYARWITEAKKEETRARRVAEAIELLKQGIKTPDQRRA